MTRIQDTKNYNLSLSEIKQIERGAWWRGIACASVVFSLLVINTMIIIYKTLIFID
jgi:hypothetical protein